MNYLEDFASIEWLNAYIFYNIKKVITVLKKQYVFKPKTKI